MGHSIGWEKSGACITYSGMVTFEDFMGAVLSIHESPDYARLRFVIHDMSTAEGLDFSKVDMIQIVAQELGARFTNLNIRASVVTSNPTMTEMVTNFSNLTKLNVRVFADVLQAREWSGSHNLA